MVAFFNIYRYKKIAAETSSNPPFEQLVLIGSTGTDQGISLNDLN
jgi:hypothetical protein